MMNRFQLAAAAVAFLVSVGYTEQTLDWPEFHGPNRDNKSAETGLLKEWPAEGPKLLWTASGLGKGYCSTAIADGLICTAGTVEKQTFVFAFDMGGKLKWKAANGASWQPTERMRWASKYDGVRSTPTLHDGLVYHLGETGHLSAFRAATGDVAWTVDLFKEFGAQSPKYGLCESVQIDGERLICCPGGTKAYMVALDRKSGKPLWSSPKMDAGVGYCSPVLSEFGGFRQFITISERDLFGMDAENGKLLWSVPFANARNNNCTDAIFHEGYVFASTGYGKGSILVKLSEENGGVKAETIWSSNLLDNHHGGVILLDGHLYGSGHKSPGWFCLDFMTGEQKHRETGKGSLTYADGMLYCLSEQGLMELVEPTPAARKVVSSFRVPSGGEGAYWAHPVVCGGRLYARHADRLYAYDIKAR